MAKKTEISRDTIEQYLVEVISPKLELMNNGFELCNTALENAVTAVNEIGKKVEDDLKGIKESLPFRVQPDDQKLETIVNQAVEASFQQHRESVEATAKIDEDDAKLLKDLASMVDKCSPQIKKSISRDDSWFWIVFVFLIFIFATFVFTCLAVRPSQEEAYAAEAYSAAVFLGRELPGNIYNEIRVDMREGRKDLAKKKVKEIISQKRLKQAKIDEWAERICHFTNTAPISKIIVTEIVDDGDNGSIAFFHRKDSDDEYVALSNGGYFWIMPANNITTVEQANDYVLKNKDGQTCH